MKYNKEKLNYHGKPDQHPLKTVSIFLLSRKHFKSEPEKENIHKPEHTYIRIIVRTILLIIEKNLKVKWRKLLKPVTRGKIYLLNLDASELELDSEAVFICIVFIRINYSPTVCWRM